MTESKHIHGIEPVILPMKPSFPCLPQQVKTKQFDYTLGSKKSDTQTIYQQCVAHSAGSVLMRGHVAWIRLRFMKNLVLTAKTSNFCLRKVKKDGKHAEAMAIRL